MAHYAKLGTNNKVLAVHVVSDNDCLNASGVEDEEVGRQFLEKIHNWPLWKKTSYNTSGGQHKNGGTPLRGNYAGIGMTYDEDNDIFIGNKPYASWILNVSEARWQSPIGDAPTLTQEQKDQSRSTVDADGNIITPATHSWSYIWNEEGQSWDLVDSLA
jgi:hypothetical protein